MKASTIILMLLFIVTFIPFRMPDDVIAFEFDRLSNEGFVAHVVNESNWDASPDDEETVDGPHEDPEKCVCKGTGKITHGDGHQTDCPYHADGDEKPDEDEDNNDNNRRVTCKCDTATTYCNCKAAYGKCSCEKFPATAGSANPIGKKPVTPSQGENSDATSHGDGVTGVDDEEGGSEGSTDIANEQVEGRPLSNSELPQVRVKSPQTPTRLPRQSTPTIVVNPPVAFNGMGSPYAAEVFTKDRQVIYFTATWCPPCIQWKDIEKPKLEKVNWIVSKDKDKAHIRIVDVDENPELFAQYGDERVPSFYRFVKGRKEAGIIGYTDAIKVADFYYGKE